MKRNMKQTIKQVMVSTLGIAAILTLIPAFFSANAFAGENGEKKQEKKFQVEFYGGMAALSPGVLNDHCRSIRLEYLSLGSYLKEAGHFNEIKKAAPFGFRLRYNLNKTISLSLGLRYVSTSEVSKKVFSAEIPKIGFEFMADIADYTISAKALAPLLGVHFCKPLGSKFDIEGFIAGGPLFGRCGFSYDSSQQSTRYAGMPDERTYKFLNIWDVEGEGTGMVLEAGAGINVELFSNFRLFLEAAYSYQKVKNVSGPGRMTEYDNYTDGPSTAVWEGTWEVWEITEEMEKAKYILNGWKYGPWGEKVKDFELDLSGFQLRLGLAYRF